MADDEPIPTVFSQQSIDDRRLLTLKPLPPARG
jgi:hypothetical protein